MRQVQRIFPFYFLFRTKGVRYILIPICYYATTNKKYKEVYGYEIQYIDIAAIFTFFCYTC